MRPESNTLTEIQDNSSQTSQIQLRTLQESHLSQLIKDSRLVKLSLKRKMKDTTEVTITLLLLLRAPSTKQLIAMLTAKKLKKKSTKHSREMQLRTDTESVKKNSKRRSNPLSTSSLENFHLVLLSLFLLSQPDVLNLVRLLDMSDQDSLMLLPLNSSRLRLH